MKMIMEESILKDFIIVRRDQFRSLESGLINYSEFITFVWLCYISDKYGYAHVLSYKWLAERLPISVKPNTVGVIMRSLRNHRLIDYSDRKGSRRGFKVTLGYWPLGKGMFRNLNSKVDEFNIIITPTESVLSSQVNKEVLIQNHRLPVLLNSIKTGVSMKSSHSLITGHNNDKKKEIKKENIDISTAINEGDCISVSGFNPQLGEHARLHFIAEMCNETCMNYLLGKYKQHGLELIKVLGKCELLYREANLKEIDNKPAFMNSLIEKELNFIDLGK